MPVIEAVSGALWPRALLFTGVLLICMIATGLYTVRLRATMTGVLLRVAAGILAGMVVLSAIFFPLAVGRYRGLRR